MFLRINLQVASKRAKSFSVYILSFEYLWSSKGLLCMQKVRRRDMFLFILFFKFMVINDKYPAFTTAEWNCSGKYNTLENIQVSK